MTFQETIRPWLLTPRLARGSNRRRPTLFLSPVGFLVYIMFMAMVYMTGYALTLTWDFGVVVYVGIVYTAVVAVKRLRARRATA